MARDFRTMEKTHHKFMAVIRRSNGMTLPELVKTLDARGTQLEMLRGFIQDATASGALVRTADASGYPRYVAVQ